MSHLSWQGGLGLRDLSEPTVDRQELLYNASVLAHHALVSTQADVGLPVPSNLSVGRVLRSTVAV